MAVFGNYRSRRNCISRQVREIEVDNADCGLDSDEEDEEEREGNDVENCGILNNTVFNVDD